ncbi:hypothetical protein B0T16DRAFT_60354 [Cercophora newfieldiana]|uniref:Uncharacterized protein n=1 Tax=Cercophora newfieldiana TaxID=92897 RepID=A0AA40CZQ0_9PEZI|nr:hypothetical protein B0T16DRAFT_60354 [Cercophora newfieldiana]
MNSDDIMSDFQGIDSAVGPSTDPNTNPSPTTTDGLAKDSQSAAAAAGPSTGVANGTGPGAWNTKKFRDEYENFKARLADQFFDGGEGPDPLLPRQASVGQYPAGVTAETEKLLKDVIAEIRAGSA